MNILLVRTGGLGDCILTLPVALCLKRINPVSKLHVLGNAAMVDAARLTGEFEGFHDVGDAVFSVLFTGKKPSQPLRNFFSLFHDVYYFTAADSEAIVRAVTSAGAGKCRVFNPVLPPDWNRHVTIHLMRMLDGCGMDLRGCHGENIIRLKNSGVRRNGLVIHPGSGSEKKNWPLDRFLAIAQEWKGDVTFVLGPAEIERGFSGRIPERFAQLHPRSLAELAHVLSGASLYLGNDSGASHCASLCGTKSVVLFGPTDPVVWKPLGDGVTVISSGDGTMEGIGCGEVVKMLMKKEDS